MKIRPMVIVTVALSCCFAGLSAVMCYSENVTQLKACNIVTPPASPTYPNCIVQSYNDAYHNVVVSSAGYYWSNPQGYKCGYDMGTWNVVLGLCISPHPQVYVGSIAVGAVPSGPDCASPD